MKKMLTRSRTNRVFGGVLGGIGEYTDVDPVVFRLGYTMLTIFTGIFPGLIAYILGLLIVPPGYGQKDV